MSILESINSAADLTKLPVARIFELAANLQQAIIRTCAVNGGHQAPSLGVVGLTIALHKIFTTPTDNIISDVGHQAYALKLLNGRRDNFSALRTLNGISGFQKLYESTYDALDAGHSFTSISANNRFCRCPGSKRTKDQGACHARP